MIPLMGGGAGMVMKVEPIYKALQKVKSKKFKVKSEKVILLSAKGKTWNQAMAKKYAASVSSVVFVCGRYEALMSRYETSR